MAEDKDATAILLAASQGDPAAADALLPLVYDELQAVAARHLRRERPDHTLQTTALVHEAYLRLIDQSRVQWRGRAHFLAVAAMAMRRILVNHAKARARVKRGGQAARLPLDEAFESFQQRSVDLEALDEALARLSKIDPDQGRMVELRFFGGLSVEETAKVLGISPRTVHREWDLAKAWLRAEVSRGDER
ncbi:MAG TPA: sigma-70 family RNA polymerase sigma factor [Phycisphaerae bacterium]|jgi:RNA polymerase sigma factor (TIGR02999 family)